MTTLRRLPNVLLMASDTPGRKFRRVTWKAHEFIFFCPHDKVLKNHNNQVYLPAVARLEDYVNPEWMEWDSSQDLFDWAEAVKRMKEGKKITSPKWGPSEYLCMNDAGRIMDQNGAWMAIDADLLVGNHWVEWGEPKSERWSAENPPSANIPVTKEILEDPKTDPLQPVRIGPPYPDEVEPSMSEEWTDEQRDALEQAKSMIDDDRR